MPSLVAALLLSPDLPGQATDSIRMVQEATIAVPVGLEVSGADLAENGSIVLLVAPCGYRHGRRRRSSSATLSAGNPVPDCRGLSD